MESGKYPIGRFSRPALVSVEEKQVWKERIRSFPAQLHHTLEGITEVQLDTPYREGGWTVRQVVHHLADSHMNSLIRFKLALTEDAPIIKPYDEAGWADQADANLPLSPSLLILEGVHQRWSTLLDAMTDSEWNRYFIHPEQQKTYTLEQALALYDWHCRHHLAHIKLVTG